MSTESESPWQKEQRLKDERNKRIVKWTLEGTDNEVWEDEVYWGFWRDVGGEVVDAPEALFVNEADARAYQQLVGVGDSVVAPAVLELQARDNFEVPE